MVLECWVIILILAIAAYMFVRSGKKAWAPGVCPLMLLPFLNILYAPIGRHIAASDSSLANIIRMLVYLVSFLGVSFWTVILARRLPKGRSRYAYVVSSVLFTAILAIIFLVKVAKL